jgi:predicted glycoside hydrolase/deacetylase ChbG (UPF0249 family)
LVDDIVDEVDLAGVQEVFLVQEFERNRDIVDAAALFAGETLIAQIGRFVESELKPDWIDGHDRCQ